MKTKTIKDGKVIKEDKPFQRKNSEGVLHNIFVMDASNSMNDTSIVDGVRVSKYTVANRGITEEIKQLKEIDTGAQEGDVHLSVIEFDSKDRGTERITEHYLNTPLKEVEKLKFRGAVGNTPLYQTIAYVINKFLRIASNKDTVLIKIFTDGEHNCFWGISEKECKDLIKDVQDNRNFIITFVGTKRDTEFAIEHLGMERGNTYSYNNTAGGAGETMDFMSMNTISLLSDKREGKSLKSKTFFKQNEDPKKDADTKI